MTSTYLDMPTSMDEGCLCLVRQRSVLDVGSFVHVVAQVAKYLNSISSYTKSDRYCRSRPDLAPILRSFVSDGLVRAIARVVHAQKDP